MAVPTFHALYAAGFFEAASPSASPLPWPSPRLPGLGSQLAPVREWGITARQASLHAADRWLAPSLLEGSTPRFDAQVSPKRRRATTKVTRFLLWPDSHRLVIVSFQDTRSLRPPA